MEQNSKDGKNKSIFHKTFTYDKDGMSVQWARALTFQQGKINNKKIIHRIKIKLDP